MVAAVSVSSAARWSVRSGGGQPTVAGLGQLQVRGHVGDHLAGAVPVVGDQHQNVVQQAHGSLREQGVPVRCWTFPGNTTDTAIIRTVTDDLAGENLRRLVWVADRGFASAANRAYLTKGGGHYIHAEKRRATNAEAAAALARPGPLQDRRRQPAAEGCTMERQAPAVHS